MVDQPTQGRPLVPEPCINLWLPLQLATVSFSSSLALEIDPKATLKRAANQPKTDKGPFACASAVAIAVVVQSRSR